MIRDLLYYNKRESFLIYLLVFAAWWQFMLGLHLFEGGLTLIWRAIHGEILLYFIIIIATVFYDNKYRVIQRSKFTNSIVVFFSICYFPILLTSLLFGAFGALLPFLQILIFLHLRDDLKVRVLDTFILVLSISLFLSLVEYLTIVFTSQYVTVFSAIPTDSGAKSFDQAIFNFIPLDDQISIGPFTFFRFQSLSDEPGNIGTICAFLLFATCDCKKYRLPYIITWISGILSFSAAFYILAAIHLAFSLKRKNLIYLFLGFVIAFIVYYSFQEVFDLFILNRFSRDNIGSLDNRSTQEFDAHLKAAFWDGSLWFGKGFGVKMDTGGHGGVAGIKAFVWIYGILGTVSILLGYILIYLWSLKRQPFPVRKIGRIFLLVFLLSFYQREYITYFDYIIIFFSMPFLLTYKGLISGSLVKKG